MEDHDPTAGSGLVHVRSIPPNGTKYCLDGEGLLSTTDGAAMPKLSEGGGPDPMHERIILETINVSSVVANALSIWQRKAHI